MAGHWTRFRRKHARIIGQVTQHDLLDNECRHPDEYELCFFIHFKGKVYRYDIEVDWEPTLHAKFTRIEPNMEEMK